MKRVVKKLSAWVMSLAMVVGLLFVAPIKSNAANQYGCPTVSYKVHRQTYGWEKEWKTDGQSSGTVGQGKRLEGIMIKVEGTEVSGLGIEYRTHIQSIGWEKTWKKNGEMSGTSGQAKRLEAIQIKLTGAESANWDVFYRVHAQTYGWLGWAKNGESAGTAGQSKRLEAIEIVIVPKGWDPAAMGCKGSMGCAFVDIAKKPSTDGTGAVSYMTHVQSYGDQKWVADGSVAGTFGEGKRLEQISIKVDNEKLGYSGGISYKTHVQSYGWMDWVSDGAKSGTSGKGKRLEGIKIKLTGELGANYDVYYRVHAQTYGWLAWAKNGEPSGTEGYGKRLEAIQIVVVPKGSEAPNNLPAKDSAQPFVSKTGGCSDSAVPENVGDEPIYIYSWNDEFKYRVETHFYSKYPQYKSKVICVNLDLSGTGEEYANKIDTLYKDGGKTVPSIVAADNDVVLSFLEKDYFVPVKNIGITSADYADAYQYTIDYATVDNELMALTWQATPGAVAYRTDIAQKVLGVSDPKSVQAQMSDWDKFFATADKLKKAGYYIVSGPDEIKYAMLDSRQSPWVANGVLNIDPAVSDYLAYSKKLYDGGYTKNATMWSSEWNDNMSKDVFCYFGCTWFIPWSLNIEGTSAFGKYNVIEGPTSYHWGGSYLMVTDKCPNKELARLLLYTMCCDTDTMYDIFAIDSDFPNNQKAVEQLIADGKGNLAKLNGQSPLPIYHANAKKLRLQNALPNDNIYNAYLDNASYETEEKYMEYYDEEYGWVGYYDYIITGYNSVDEAIVKLKEQVSVGFPNVKIPN